MTGRDTRAFWEADAAEHMGFAYQYGRNPNVRYPMYEIRRERILEIMDRRPKGSVLDAGCGAAHILIECLDRGWDGYGFDFAQNMVALAHGLMKKHGYDPARVRVGAMDDLLCYADQSFDVVLLLGVSQYLPPEQDGAIWDGINRILKPHGIVLIDFVNALFDLSTFNRFTIRFMVDQCAVHFFSSDRLPDIEKRIANLVSNPQKPDTVGLYATRRDHVTKRTENPLTVTARMKALNFEVDDIQFYRYHAVPPLLFEQDPALEKIAIEKEAELAHHWIGHFMASAFIAVLRKA